jgi:acetyl-CoA acetyltransferase
MCSAVNDGGCAVILTREDVASDTRKSPIRVLAGGNQQPYPAYYEVPALDAVEDEGRFVSEAFARAGISRDDVDFLELYDHFAIGVLLELELYGFCGAGEAADFVANGGIGLDGPLPTCTDGGCLSFSHNVMPSLLRVVETVRQLRKEVRDMCPECEAGEHSYDPTECRAVRDARIGFASSQGPPTGGGTFVVLGVE